MASFHLASLLLFGGFFCEKYDSLVLESDFVLLAAQFAFMQLNCSVFIILKAEFMHFELLSRGAVWNALGLLLTPKKG